jgi:uncharacterized membrane protein
MINLIRTGQIIFGVGSIGLAILGVLSKDFVVGRPPAWTTELGPNPALAYVSAAFLFVLASAIIIQKWGGVAASIIAIMILLLSVVRHLAVFMSDWPNTFKALGLFGGSLIIACSFFREDYPRAHTLPISERLQKGMMLLGTILLAIFFIVGGYAHFKFAEFVNYLIPGYIPFTMFWTYFSGICLVAGGVGLLIPKTQKWAALLSGIMVLGWFFLLHIPRVVANSHDVGERLGVCESFTFAGIFFVLAGIFSKEKRYQIFDKIILKEKHT